jgi:glycerol uptake facilitator-like aquaporin
MTFNLTRRLVSEFLGTALLLAAVVGSGIMAEKLSGGNAGLALLANSLATGAALFVLITILGPVSGAHFNPAVTLVMRLKIAISNSDAVLYAVAQIAGGIAGVLITHVMFDLNVLQTSATPRTGVGQWTAEAVAAFGLILTILGAARFAADKVAMSVALYIVSAYWFTASTSFANPAVTVARSVTNTFAGIAPADVAAFIAAQIAGAVLGQVIGGWLFGTGGAAKAEV